MKKDSAYFSKIGTIGGKSKSKAKQKASRENGKMGGRQPVDANKTKGKK